MSFSIGGSGPGLGPRSAMEAFGGELREGVFFNPAVVRRLLRFLNPYKSQMVLGAVLMLVESGLTLLIPLLLKTAIDGYIAPGHLAGLDRFALALAGAYLGLFGASAGQGYLLGWVGQQVLADLRGFLFRHLQSLSKGFHDTHIVGVTVSRVINDVAEINELLSQGLISLLGNLIVLVGILVVLFRLDARLALLAFSVLPLMVMVTLWFSKQARHAFRQTRSNVAAVVGEMAEDIAAMRVIQTFAQEDATVRRFEEVNEANRSGYIRAISLSFVFLPTIEFLGMLAMVIVLFWGGRSAAAGGITIGALVAFLSYVSRFFQPVQEMSRLFTTWQSAMAAGEQVLNLLDTPSSVQDRANARDLPPIQGKIEFEHVYFRYRDETTYVLEDIHLTIQPGQTVALVGPTGAGKTTIASLLARFYDVTQGAVRVDGCDLREITQESLHRQIALVGQDPFLFSRTIGENIAFSSPHASQAEIEAAARRANAHEFIAALPEGYATRVLEGSANLSVGQRQLISIARALLANPRILILDEATANVDTISEKLIQAAIAELLKSRTALVIAHRLSTITHADQIYVIHQGRIVEQGTHVELLEVGGMYASLHSGWGQSKKA